MLREFYEAYLQWVHDGAEEMAKGYSRYTGLCGNVGSLSQYYHIPYSVCVQLDDEMKAAFEADGLDGSYPFNDGDQGNFNEETGFGLAHKNEFRLAWLRKQIEELSDGEKKKGI
jgi:hypothetical protein